MKHYLALLAFAMLAFPSTSQVAKEQVVQINVETGANFITLKWPLEVGHSGNFLVHRRENIGEEWGNPIATVAGNENSYIDKTIEVGKAYEYFIIKTTGSQALAYGYVQSGVRRVLNPMRGGLILLIDSMYIDPLKDELAVYEQDATAEGFVVYRIYAGRTEKPRKVKKRITDLYEAQNGDISTIFIIGNVPVPYSGDFKAGSIPPPDGHIEGVGNHTGAWPADVFYADMDGRWDDVTVNNTSGHEERLYNTPGDGKFDPTKLPSEVELEIGRLDLTNMTVFNTWSDVELTKNYLIRNHAWRTDQWRATERAIIDNNFKQHNLASSGYHNFSTMLPIDSIADDQDLLTETRKRDYLWTYGCGAGSYSTCSGVGKSSDWSDTSHTVFSMLAGSFFGDWDVPNNFLKAPLCFYTLATMWAGIPKWYSHHMALGGTIGYGTKITQNNIDEYFNGAFNASYNSIHIALMGDPTLRMRNLPTLSNLVANSTNKTVELKWNSANGDFEGYLVYRFDSSGSYVLLTETPITDTFFTDDQNFYTGKYTYAVHPSRLETTASGTFYNIGGGDRQEVDFVNNTSPVLSSAQISLYPNPVNSRLNVNLDLRIDRNYQWKILNTKGQILEKGTSDANHFSIGTEQLQTGIYFLEVNTTAGTSTQKFMKQ